MGERISALTPMEGWNVADAPPRTAAELVGGLEAAWHMIDDALHRWKTSDLEQKFRLGETSVSRQWIIWHVIEHDLHHGGELSLTMGMHGLAASDF